MNKENFEKLVDNTTWENSNFGLTYKFINGKELWINGNNHFFYKIAETENGIEIHYSPNGGILKILKNAYDYIVLSESGNSFTIILVTN